MKNKCIQRNWGNSDDDGWLVLFVFFGHVNQKSVRDNLNMRREFEKINKTSHLFCFVIAFYPAKLCITQPRKKNKSKCRRQPQPNFSYWKWKMSQKNTLYDDNMCKFSDWHGQNNQDSNWPIFFQERKFIVPDGTPVFIIGLCSVLTKQGECPGFSACFSLRRLNCSFRAHNAKSDQSLIFVGVWSQQGISVDCFYINNDHAKVVEYSRHWAYAFNVILCFYIRLWSDFASCVPNKQFKRRREKQALNPGDSPCLVLTMRP